MIFGELFADGVDKRGVLVRGDGERRGEIVVSALARGLRRAGEPENKALSAPRAALCLCFQPRRGEAERRLVPLRDDQSDIFAERRRFEQVLLPEEPLFPFLRGEDVRVIEENVDIEMRREPLETRARARAAAAVKKEPGAGVKRRDERVHLPLIVSLLHGVSLLPSKRLFIL